MEKVSYTGNDGCAMKLHQIHGTLVPPFMKSEKGYQTLLKLQAREDDVLICGFPKAGTHWMIEVISMLLKGTTDYLKVDKRSLMLDSTDPIEGGDLSHYDEMDSPRVLNTHLPLALLPPDFLKKKSKFIYLIRNPKDITVSFYSHLSSLKMLDYHGSFAAFFQLFIDGHVPYGSVFDGLIRWHNDKEAHPEIPFMILYYEDTKEDFMKQARRLCDFLGISRDDEFLASVQTACSFEKMKATAEEQGAADPNKPKGNIIFRKGGVGDWKNWFTVAQNEIFDKISNDKLQGLNYNFKYQL